MNYYIHPSHGNHGDQENQPHVHVCFGSKTDKSTQISVSLISCKAIIAGRNTTYRDQKEAEEFVMRNQRELQREWDRKANCDW